jgi:hypothetical protein
MNLHAMRCIVCISQEDHTMAKLKATPKNYAQAWEALSGKQSIRLGNNTYLEVANERVYEDGRIPEERKVIAVRLHSTHVVKFYEDGRVTLHTGGYYTVTTKDRINEFITGCVYQKDHQWYYVGHNLEGALDWEHPDDFTEGYNVVKGLPQ